MQPEIVPFFDPATSTVTYVVADRSTGRAAIIDAVLDYDPKSGRTTTASADAVIAYVRSSGLTVEWILETHVHADHLSAAAYLKEHLGGRTAIGENVKSVQQVFKQMFNAEPSFAPDGSQFDHLFRDGERFSIGALTVEVIHTPGHTPACMTYVIGDAAFVGDTLFMPDYGTARCDFPGGDAATLYRSIQRILSLPPDTGSSCAMTISRVAGRRFGKAPSPKSARRTFTFMTASARRISSSTAPHATKLSKCPC